MTARALAALAAILLTMLLGAAMLLYAPGWGIDIDRFEHEGAATGAEAAKPSLTSWSVSYFSGLFSGNLGTSTLMQAPVRDLIGARWPATAALVSGGLVAGWAAGLALALVALTGTSTARVAATVSALLLATPLVLLALLTLYYGLPPVWMIAAAVCPRVFLHTRAALLEAGAADHLVAARARGLRTWRIALFHLFLPAAAPIAGLLGPTASLAISACIPVEVLLDIPGMGQLAWKAALARDLPVLVNIFVLIAGVTVVINSFGEGLLRTCWDRVQA